MNTEENEQDLKSRLRELEVSTPTNVYPATIQTSTSKESSEELNKFINLFKSLSSTGKIIAVSVATIVGFAVLKSLVSLVATLFSLAFLGLVVYFVYQFLVARSQKI